MGLAGLKKTTQDKQESMPIATIDTLPGYEILEYKGRTMSVVSVSLSGDAAAVERGMRNAYREVFEGAEMFAKRSGGNAIVGLNLFYTPYDLGTKLMITIMGTSVLARKKKEESVVTKQQTGRLP